MVDFELSERVAQALSNSPHLPFRCVTNEARQGHVILRGVVRSYYQKQMAQETLRGLEGVAEIENQLEVNWA